MILGAIKNLQPLLAEALVHVLTFAGQTASLYKAAYDGRPITDPAVQNRVTIMANAAKDLEAHCRSSSPRTRAEDELHDLANKVRVTTGQLQTLINELNKPGTKGTTLRLIKLPLMFGRNKSKISKLEEQLEGYEKTLQSRLLASVL